MSRYFNRGTLNETSKPPSKIERWWSNIIGEWDGVMPDTPMSDSDSRAGGIVDLYNGDTFIGRKQIMDTPRGCYLVDGKLFTGDGNESGYGVNGSKLNIKPVYNGRG